MDAQSIRTNFLEQNKDWQEFVCSVSDNTGNAFLDLWVANAKLNKGLISKYGWAASDLQEAHKGKTAVMLGASPNIRTQIDFLKKLRQDPGFIFIGVSSGLKYFLEQGLKPHYVMIADGQAEIEKHWAGIDMEQTKDITLIANICAFHPMIAKWKGDIKFIAVYSAIDTLDKQIMEDYAPINGIGRYFPALCSQYNTGVAVAYLIFRTEVIIFVGNELSFPTEETPYYVDRQDLKDAYDRKPHIDIRGKKVFTNYMLMSLKFTLEDFLGKLPGWFFNASEAGIFGVSSRYGNLPWIYQFTLPMAVAQANSIMRTGKPITSLTH